MVALEISWIYLYIKRPTLYFQVHILPREMFGFSTFGIAMALLKWLPLRLVDKLLLLAANFTLGNTDSLGLRRPKTGPIELKNATGKTPVLDVGAISQIKSGKIKVINNPNTPYMVSITFSLLFAIIFCTIFSMSFILLLEFSRLWKV